MQLTENGLRDNERRKKLKPAENAPKPNAEISQDRE
jgi:hypothetical protein